MAHLEKPGEDVKLKDGDVVVAGEVNGRFKRHGLQARADGVKLMQGLPEHFPRHDGPEIQRNLGCYQNQTVLLF